MLDCKISLLITTQSKQTVVAGRTIERGTPVSRQVRVYGRSNGALLGSTYSNKSGDYKFYLPLDIAYTIVSIDLNRQFNAVIQDNVVPK
ncbi:hypothetical protein [Acinetobacter wuhouensis]|uniref:Carboxypeptidase regulatory-like domain-containing protein n=1 Tax=Acinetobacter wuhouensis TaxID=1879050 RepID=A0A3G2T2T5_9GAMM|nr:hypothetical protein [Acinetobacter wuhouensis]AYO54391.1 hypothetical protein CDG68_12420 [Acinetobacter wuhouensis]